MNENECPTCGRTDFKNEKGMLQHHTMVHGESLTVKELECANCGEKFSRQRTNIKNEDVVCCSNDCLFEWKSDNLSGENHPQWQGLSKDCEACGDSFHVSRSIIDKRRTCSYECRDYLKSQELSGEDHHQYKERVGLECGTCGSDFEVYPFQAEFRQFCSHECAVDIEGEDHWLYDCIIVECAWCGSELERHPYRLDRSDNQFCDQECLGKWNTENNVGEAHPNFEGGRFPYGPGFSPGKKEKVRDRDGRRCVNCGRTEEEHIQKFGRKHSVHHIQKARSFEDPEARNDMSNLVTLCEATCHSKWEGIPLRPEPVKTAK